MPLTRSGTKSQSSGLPVGPTSLELSKLKQKNKITKKIAEDPHFPYSYSNIVLKPSQGYNPNFIPIVQERTSLASGSRQITVQPIDSTGQHFALDMLFEPSVDMFFGGVQHGQTGGHFHFYIAPIKSFIAVLGNDSRVFSFGYGKGKPFLESVKYLIQENIRLFPVIPNPDLRQTILSALIGSPQEIGFVIVNGAGGPIILEPRLLGNLETQEELELYNNGIQKATAEAAQRAAASEGGKSKKKSIKRKKNKQKRSKKTKKAKKSRISKIKTRTHRRH